ncbi:plasmid recombination protein, partial [Magnetospirillum molischianum]|uniref:plasmid recombination protein n=1 Tax=Magnetospirillum molischianum TaxID=1083 RepID=UPI001F387424
MSYQFAHISTFSRKGNSVGRSVADVTAEAARLDGHAPHVEQPQPPTVLHGIDPAEVPAEIERRVREAKAAMRGQGRGNSVRADTHVMEGVVLSHPSRCADLAADPDQRRAYEAWRDEAARWLIEDGRRRGVEVVSIVEHRDEKHPHIHALAIPLNARLDAKQAHPGYAALAASKEAGLGAKQCNLAYRDAMRVWQDRYHNDIGMRHGQTRIGPGRRRLTRAEWKAEAAEAQRTAQRLTNVNAAEIAVDYKHQMANQVIREARQKAQDALATADILAAQKIDQAASKGRQIEAAAVAKADAITTGVEMWSNGTLEPGTINAKGQKRLVLHVPEAEKPKVINRLSPAWDWLYDWSPPQLSRCASFRSTTFSGTRVMTRRSTW